MYRLLLSAAALAFSVSAAQAAEVVVTPGDLSWNSIPTTGTAQITAAAPRSGNGSLELKGDRSRFVTTFTPFALSTVSSLTFDWQIAADAVPQLNPDYTPALRLLVNDGSAFREITWEGAYNGVYGPQTDPGVWYSTGTGDKFYVGTGNENAGKSIAAWATSNPDWTVYGISVGHGSSAGIGYHAFADNVTLTRSDGSVTTYNFETAAAVPEPATWAMMLVGFGAVGYASRRRTRVRFAQAV